MHSFTIVITLVLFSLANLLTSYLYLYPIFHGCRFGDKPSQLRNGRIVPGHVAPFRLLVFGDPQLEGSTSLATTDFLRFPSLETLVQDVWADTNHVGRLNIVQKHLQDFVGVDLPIQLQSWRKRLDLLGNDYYLAHINRCLQWFTYPTHTAVLGDLLGSQWISDAEFEARGRRYWGRVFAGGNRVEDEVTSQIMTTTLVKKDKSWVHRIINVAGNHDVGYAGDMTLEKVERFERVFGKTNYVTRITLPVSMLWDKPAPELRIVVLNSLNIDSPVLDSALQSNTFEFINSAIDSSPSPSETSSSTILLTHLPLHKEQGVCVDGPHIEYYTEGPVGTIKEQNHLSADLSAQLLTGFFGVDPESGDSPLRHGIILTGHDHEGCDTYHHLPAGTSNEDGETRRVWAAEKWEQHNATRHAGVSGIREITVRSMMGDFGGNAGMLSAWFDPDEMKWDFDYRTCVLGKQHFWWAVHILDLIALPFCIYVGWNAAVGESAAEEGTRSQEKQKTL